MAMEEKLVFLNETQEAIIAAAEALGTSKDQTHRPIRVLIVSVVNKKGGLYYPRGLSTVANELRSKHNWCVVSGAPCLFLWNMEDAEKGPQNVVIDDIYEFTPTMMRWVSTMRYNNKNVVILCRCEPPNVPWAEYMDVTDAPSVMEKGGGW